MVIAFEPSPGGAHLTSFTLYTRIDCNTDMKIKTLSGLLFVEILTLILIFLISFAPSNVFRIVLGLPFFLYFPGYTLVEALFIRKNGERDGEALEPVQSEARKHEITDFERIVVSFGMSIALAALIGLGLNYTPFGITLQSTLVALSAFVILAANIALVRRAMAYGKTSFVTEITLRLPGWEGSPLSKALTLVLALSVVAAVGTLAFSVAFPKNGEKFTEFYILGYFDKAQDYPYQFAWDSANQIPAGVFYGEGSSLYVEGAYGKVTAGIINREQKETTYSLKVFVGGQQVYVQSGGQTVIQVLGIVLDNDQKWEKEIGFSPLHAGDQQKVEFVLYKDGGVEVYREVHFWADVK